MFNFSNDSTKPKYYNDSNKSFIVKINDKNAAVRLKPKIYSFLMEDDSEHKKAKSININFNWKTTHNEIMIYCLILNVWDIQLIKFNVKIIKQDIMKSAGFCFACSGDKIYVQNNGYDELALDY